MEQLRLKLIETINESGLPLEAALFVVRDVYRDIMDTYRQAEEAAKVAPVSASKEEE